MSILITIKMISSKIKNEKENSTHWNNHDMEKIKNRTFGNMYNWILCIFKKYEIISFSENAMTNTHSLINAYFPPIFNKEWK